MQTHEKPIANPVVVLREEFDDWAILFNPDTAEAVGINPVGVALWKLMDGERSLKDLVEEVNHLFSDVPDSAIEDVSLFVSKLTQGGFVGYGLQEFSK
jgi:SynChlorMet cassette protein ScmD